MSPQYLMHYCITSSSSTSTEKFLAIKLGAFFVGEARCFYDREPGGVGIRDPHHP